MAEDATNDGKQAYYLHRATQERELARRTVDRSARRVHDELANRYAVLAAESVETPPEAARVSQSA